MFFRSIVAVLLISLVYGEHQTSSRFTSLLNALTKGLEFMKKHINEINLDGVLGVRLVEEQLQAYLEFEPEVFENFRWELEVIHDEAAAISDEGEKLVKENDVEYSESIGRIMERSKRLLWHPSRRINPQTVTSPISCFQSVFNETSSDGCLREVVGTWSKMDDSCRMSEKCVQWNTSPRQRDYVLTHQVLYWQLLEMRNCITDTSPALKVSLCSNVMRDANRIANAYFPLNHQDLLMEQIGLCGMWGFEDFYKPEWLDKILEWQLPSGCFAHRMKWRCTDILVPDVKTRVKRREKILHDGCLSHKTTVALLALTVSIRFEAERLYNMI